MMDRRNFIRGAVAAAFLATLPPSILMARKPDDLPAPYAFVWLPSMHYSRMTGEPFTRLQFGDVLTFEAQPHNHKFRVSEIDLSRMRAQLTKVDV